MCISQFRWTFVDYKTRSIISKKWLKSNSNTRCFRLNGSLSYCKYSSMFTALLLTFQFQAHDDRSAQLWYGWTEFSWKQGYHFPEKLFRACAVALKTPTPAASTTLAALHISTLGWIQYFSRIQLVVYHQCCVLIGWATSRLYVIAH